MKTIEALKASMKLERKETKEWYRLIVEMYTDLSPDFMQKAIDYLQEYINHYEKQVKMFDKTLAKLVSKKDNS